MASGKPGCSMLIPVPTDAAFKVLRVGTTGLLVRVNQGCRSSVLGSCIEVAAAMRIPTEPFGPEETHRRISGREIMTALSGGFAFGCIIGVY